jgi:hypothetical protein
MLFYARRLGDGDRRGCAWCRGVEVARRTSALVSGEVLQAPLPSECYSFCPQDIDWRSASRSVLQSCYGAEYCKWYDVALTSSERSSFYALVA